MKLEFESVEELTEFYKKYIEKKEPIKRDLIVQSRGNNLGDYEDILKS